MSILKSDKRREAREREVTRRPRGEEMKKEEEGGAANQNLSQKYPLFFSLSIPLHLSPPSFVSLSIHISSLPFSSQYLMN